MTNEQILKRAIEKAIKNDKDFENQDAMYGSLFEDFIKTLLDGKLYYRLIFSHDFAKAFWGQKPFCKKCEVLQVFCAAEGCGINLKTGKQINGVEEWQYHLSEMVLEKNPLKYLKKFL